MGKKQELGPTDVAYAFVKDGKLIIVDARAMPWVYEGSKAKKGEDAPEAPGDVAECFVINERLHVVDGSNMTWTYNPARSIWIKGEELDIEADEEPAAVEGEEPKDYPWIKGKTFEIGPVHGDLVREARATVAAEDEKANEGKKSSKKAA